MNLYLDIETIATNTQTHIDYIEKTIKPPAVMKKAETIARWEAEEKQSAIDEAVARTGLDGAMGRICVIGFALEDDEVLLHASADNEASVLAGFADVMRSADIFNLTTIGHYVSGFDLRFLLQRYMVNRITPPEFLRRAVDAKSWESEKVFDTMTQWAGFKGSISLDKLCMALGIESPKGDMDGSMVNQYVKDGRLNEVVEYCKRDVEAVRAVHKRMTFY
jgi:hypothetical protein